MSLLCYVSAFFSGQIQVITINFESPVHHLHRYINILVLPGSRESHVFWGGRVTKLNFFKYRFDVTK